MAPMLSNRFSITPLSLLQFAPGQTTNRLAVGTFNAVWPQHVVVDLDYLGCLFSYPPDRQLGQTHHYSRNPAVGRLAGCRVLPFWELAWDSPRPPLFGAPPR